MQSKSLLIAVAAFAVTATGVHAHGGSKLLSRAGLNNSQVVAIEEAQQLRAAGNLDAARDKLVEAGITEDTLRSIHAAAKKNRGAIYDAAEDGDYKAFKEAISDSPLADIITTENDFQQFIEAHELKQAGEWEEAQSLLEELGITGKDRRHGHGFHHRHWLHELSGDQLEALRIAKAANDQITIRAILDEAGIRKHR